MVQVAMKQCEQPHPASVRPRTEYTRRACAGNVAIQRCGTSHPHRTFISELAIHGRPRDVSRLPIGRRAASSGDSSDGVDGDRCHC
jgi:ethanolamine ammonia-lyase small subunit